MSTLNLELLILTHSTIEPIPKSHAFTKRKRTASGNKRKVLVPSTFVNVSVVSHVLLHGTVFNSDLRT